MIGFVFRWLLPGFGLAMVAMALIGAPWRGEPPLASLWHPRVETVVTRAEIIEVAFVPITTACAPVSRIRARSASTRAETNAAVKGLRSVLT